MAALVEDRKQLPQRGGIETRRHPDDAIIAQNDLQRRDRGR